MSTSIISESMVLNAGESQSVTSNIAAALMEVDSAKCDCCGLTEECTLSYIQTIRERYQGKWICGLCAEAVKYEMMRCERLISAEEALNRHISFCKKFNSSVPPPNPTVHLIAAMRQILRRGFESPKSLRSMPSSPTKISTEMNPTFFARSESCIPSLSLVDSTSFHDMEIDIDRDCD